MDLDLIRIAAKACQAAYQDNTDLGTTEFSDTIHPWNGGHIQVLAIPGTNEAADWLKNINLWSTQGIKKVAVDAAREIKARFGRIPELPLLVTGHSKAGPTAIAWKRLIGADHCIAFCPARSLRYWAKRKMENTILIIDPDDPVPKVGAVSFGHPICPRITLPNDFGLKVSDHFMDHIIEFFERKN